MTTSLERSLSDSMLPPIVLAAATSTEVVPSSVVTQDDIVSIELFNSGAANAYYAYGRTCDNATNYNAYLVPGQMLAVPVRQAVSMYSVAGTTISRTILRRTSSVGQNIL